jgi:Helix-turn-helix domain
MKDTSQVLTLVNHLLSGATIDRVEAFRMYGIADLRSRISDVERDYKIAIDRRTKEGKRYREYFVKNKQLNLL